MVEEYIRAGAIKHFALSPRYEADLQYSLQIRRIILSENIDIIHAHELLIGSLAIFGAWLALLSCKLRRPPSAYSLQRIYHVHTPFSQWQHKSFKKIPALIINTIVNFVVGNIFATNVLALTPSIKRHRIYKEFILPSKITVIPNGIDLSVFKYSKSERMKFRKKYNLSSNDIVIGNISRFTQEKGHEILIKAFSEVLKLNQFSLKLVLAGSGNLLNSMKSLAVELKIQDKVIFTEKFDEEDKIGILSSFDLFVFPSYAEGFGIVLLEAMAVGLPIIASDIPVLKDVGGNSLEYVHIQKSEKTIINLAKSMDSLIKDKSKLIEMKEKSIQASKKYSIQIFWTNYKTLYCV